MYVFMYLSAHRKDLFNSKIIFPKIVFFLFAAALIHVASTAVLTQRTLQIKSKQTLKCVYIA